MGMIGAKNVAGFLAGYSSEHPGFRGLIGSIVVALSAMMRQWPSALVRIVIGLKIRVSAVRFCPWPLFFEG